MHLHYIFIDAFTEYEIYANVQSFQIAFIASYTTKHLTISLSIDRTRSQKPYRISVKKRTRGHFA